MNGPPGQGGLVKRLIFDEIAQLKPQLVSLPKMHYLDFAASPAYASSVGMQQQMGTIAERKRRQAPCTLR